MADEQLISTSDGEMYLTQHAGELNRANLFLNLKKMTFMPVSSKCSKIQDIRPQSRPTDQHVIKNGFRQPETARTIL